MFRYLGMPDEFPFALSLSMGCPFMVRQTCPELAEGSTTSGRYPVPLILSLSKDAHRA
jgi:hypothetical protein